MNHQEKLQVLVHYVAAGRPFKDDETDREETVGHLKVRVLSFFGLTEGSAPDGSVVNYSLYHERTALNDMNQKLGELVDHQNILQLKLVQQLVQGNA